MSTICIFSLNEKEKQLQELLGVEDGLMTTFLAKYREDNKKEDSYVPAEVELRQYLKENGVKIPYTSKSNIVINGQGEFSAIHLNSETKIPITEIDMKGDMYVDRLPPGVFKTIQHLITARYVLASKKLSLEDKKTIIDSLYNTTDLSTVDKVKALLNIPAAFETQAVGNTIQSLLLPLLKNNYNQIASETSDNIINALLRSGEAHLQYDDMNDPINKATAEALESLRENLKNIFEAYYNELNKTETGVPLDNRVETFDGFWTREDVQNNPDKIFLFGDNTDDRTRTHHVPTSTQAVIRGLLNAFGIDTKKDRGSRGVGENVSSKGSALAKRLANPGNNMPITFRGKEFKNAEHAYQTWKSGEFDQQAYNQGVDGAFKPQGTKPVNKDISYDLMVEILTEKFKQHPELVAETEREGGTEHIRNSTHQENGDQFWEKEGNFIKALHQAALNAGMKNTSSYFTDADFDQFKAQVDEVIARAKKSGKKIVLPKYGIGTGKAQLKERAPKLFAYLQQELEKLGAKSQKQEETKGMPVVKIISGGQTGVDTIALQVAQELGIETGGFAPMGFMREEGIDGIDVTQFGLQEITQEQQEAYNNKVGDTTKTDTALKYLARTEQNVINSDATVYFKVGDIDNAGYYATARAAKEHNKPFFVYLGNRNSMAEFRKFLRDNNVKVLNVAGNRGSALPSMNAIPNILRVALGGKASDKDVISEDGTLSYAEEKLPPRDPNIFGKPRFHSHMDFNFGKSAAAGFENMTAMQAVVAGLKTQSTFGQNTTRTGPNLANYFKNAREGQIIEFTSGDKRTKLDYESIYVRVKSVKYIDPRGIDIDEWSAKEGFNAENFNRRIAPNGVVTVVEYEYVPNSYRSAAMGRTPQSAVESFTAEMVKNDQNRVYLFEDTMDAAASKTGLRELQNAFAIKTKKREGRKKEDYYTDDDYAEFVEQVSTAIQNALSTGKTVVLPELGMGHKLKEKAPKLYDYLQSKLQEVKNATRESQYTGEDFTRFNIDQEVTPEVMDKIDLLFEPNERRDRITLIHNKFSEAITRAVEQLKDQIRNRAIELSARNGKSVEENISEQEKEYKNSNAEKLAKISTSNDRVLIEELRKQIHAVDRMSAINIFTPLGIFNMVREELEGFLNKSEEEQEDEVVTLLEEQYGAEQLEYFIEKYGDSWFNDTVSSKTQYRRDALKKMVEDPAVFKGLCEEASLYIAETEGIRVDPNYKVAEEMNFLDEDGEGISSTEKAIDPLLQEEAYKDGWMTKYREVSGFESMSKQVRAVLSRCSKINPNSKRVEYDDLSYKRYIDSSYAFATIIDATRNMITGEDLIPCLEKIEANKPWIREIINKLQEDELLLSQFYQTFRKDFLNYWIQKKELNPDGSYKIKTIVINRPEGTYFLLDSWRDNQESGTILDNDSLYDENGYINVENATIGKNIAERLRAAYQAIEEDTEITPEVVQEFLDNKEVWDDITKALHMAGMQFDPEVLRLGLENGDLIENKTPLSYMISKLHTLYYSIEKGVEYDDGKALGEEEEQLFSDEPGKKRLDLINKFSRVYNGIALIMSNVSEAAFESNARQGDKSYYAHVNPCYLLKLIKEMKGEHANEKRLKEFIDREYTKYKWFCTIDDNGKIHWKNDILAQLFETDENGYFTAASAVARAELEHKNLITFDNNKYEDWSGLDATLILLTEYDNGEDPDNSTIKHAYYNLPIYSDSPSAEFLRLRKYTSGDAYDSYGNEMTYQQIISEKMVDLVLQEFERIGDVHVREKAIREGKINALANFDMRRDSEGNITWYGGAEFKFLPALNSYYIGKTEDNPGELFIDYLNRMALESDINGSNVKHTIQNAIIDIMENEFDKNLERWEKIGLFQEVENGHKYKYLNKPGAHTQNQAIAGALKAVRNIIGEQFTQEMESAIKVLEKDRFVGTKTFRRILQNIDEALGAKVAEGTITEARKDNIMSELKSENAAIEHLREYFWNSSYATSQIIQITATDLAYYKNMEDFQKRYKEVHAPSLRLNTFATYKGERVSDGIERAIYIKDKEIVSTMQKEVESVIITKFRNEELTAFDACNILAKFGVSNFMDGKTAYYKIGRFRVKSSKVNVADGQSFRSLSSYRAVQIMQGQWSTEEENAYNNIKNGKFDINDFNVVWMTKKPYLYSQVSMDKGIGKGELMKVGVQHKNSEFLLLAMYQSIMGPQYKSPHLKALNTFIEDNNIDVVHFESVVKVGKQGIIDLDNKQSIMVDGAVYDRNSYKEYLKSKNPDIKDSEIQEQLDEKFSIKTEKDVIEALEFATGKKVINNGKVENGTFNPEVVHEFSYEDYGIQVATPEHLVDAVQLVGTQIRKQITADIDENAIINTDEMMVDFSKLNPKTYIPAIGITAGQIIKQGGLTKAQWLAYYNAINTENIIESFREIDEIFSDPKQIEKVLLEELRGSTRYSIDLQRACTLDENGRFNIPLFEPMQSQRVQQLINSIIKSRVTKQKIKGGALIQVSNYGLTEDLNVVFKTKDGTILDKNTWLKNNPKKTEEQFYVFRDKQLELGELAVAYFECYMPAYSEQFFKYFMKPGTHELDINKMPEELRKAIGYRVPTEDKYSMAPLYIKGFLPQQNGSAIMLPADITTISGSDFDVDKMYVMLYEFEEKAYDREKAYKDYLKEKEGNRSIKEILSRYKEFFPNSQSVDDLINMEDDSSFKDWFEENKNNYKVKPSLEKIRYKHNKMPFQNSRKARNNLMIDMMWGVLTNTDTASKILNPGSADYQKKASRINTILMNISREDLIKELKNALNIAPEKKSVLETQIANALEGGKHISLADIHPLMKTLFDLDLKTIDSIAEKYRPALNPLSPTTYVTLHQQNMVGGKMISIYANHTASHAVIQHTQLKVKDDYAITLNGKKYTSLHSIKNESGELISKNTAGWLNAAVDDTKEKVLPDLNQNTFTADVAMLLSRLGYNPIEIGLLLGQPIIMELTQRYFREKNNGKNADSLLRDLIKEYEELGEPLKGLASYDYKNHQFKAEDLANDIMVGQNIREMTTEEIKNKKDVSYELYYKHQIGVAYFFRELLSISKGLDKVIKATRADSQGGAAGPTIADTQEKINRVDELYYAIDTGMIALENADVIRQYDPYETPDYIQFDKDGNWRSLPQNDIKEYSELVASAVEPTLKDMKVRWENNKPVYYLNPENKAYNLKSKKAKEIIARMAILNSPMPIVQAMYTCGVQRPQTLLAQHFPQFNKYWTDTARYIENQTKDGRMDVKLRNKIYNEYFAYLMTKLPFFGSDDSLSVTDKRRAFLTTFVSYHYDIMRKHPELQHNEFIQRLKVIKHNKNNPFPTVTFKNVGNVNKTQRERLERGWCSLIYNSDPEVVMYALNLIRYNFFRNGFAFGPNTFINLVNTTLKRAIPGYIEGLFELLDPNSEFSTPRVNEDNVDIEFASQFMLNNLDNRKLCPYLGPKATIAVVDANGNIKDEVIVTADDLKNTENNSLVKRTERFKDHETKEWSEVRLPFTYFCRKVNGKFVYYQLSGAEGSLIYKRVEPLGYKNNFIEYEYGKHASEVSTVIRRNTKDANSFVKIVDGKFKGASRGSIEMDPNEMAEYSAFDGGNDLSDTMDAEYLGQLEDKNSQAAQMNALNQALANTFKSNQQIQEHSIQQQVDNDAVNKINKEKDELVKNQCK